MEYVVGAAPSLDGTQPVSSGSSSSPVSVTALSKGDVVVGVASSRDDDVMDAGVGPGRRVRSDVRFQLLMLQVLLLVL